MPASHDPPSFQFYPRDWIVDTRHLSRDERCRYWDALCDSWVSRSYGVATEDQWRQWLGYTVEEWPTHRETFARLFKVRRGAWVQQRMHDEREAQSRRHERASAGGKMAQESLRNKKMGSTADYRLNLSFGTASTPASASASASATSKPTPTRAARAVRSDWKDAFQKFWSVFPRKVAKIEAERVWVRLQPTNDTQDEDTFNAIMDGLESDVAKWTASGLLNGGIDRDGRPNIDHIPHPRTWLNQRRWLDHTEEANR